MRVLVAYGSKMGGTAGLADMLGENLRAKGLEVDVRPGPEVTDVADYDAVVIGGALYATRWHRDARRVVRRHRRALSQRPVWLFSSGPLDDTATLRKIPPTRQVRGLMTLIGARSHETFGGWLPDDATGFPASAMARDNAGDWRDPDHVACFGARIAEALAQETGHPTETA